MVQFTLGFWGTNSGWERAKSLRPTFYLLKEKNKEAEQWAILYIDQLMPQPGFHLMGSEKPCFPPVSPKVLGGLSLRGTPWGSFTASPGDP